MAGIARACHFGSLSKSCTKLSAILAIANIVPNLPYDIVRINLSFFFLALTILLCIIREKKARKKMEKLVLIAVKGKYKVYREKTYPNGYHRQLVATFKTSHAAERFMNGQVS